jgi:hypothetical protein
MFIEVDGSKLRFSVTRRCWGLRSAGRGSYLGEAVRTAAEKNWRGRTVWNWRGRDVGLRGEDSPKAKPFSETIKLVL